MKRATDFTEGSDELPPSKVLCQRDDLLLDSLASSSSSFTSSSISSTRKWTYDVFLSFSGEDTRNTATDFMYYALQEKGISTFKDDQKLEKGKTIRPELLKAIKESKFAVVILSKNYASSTWCLDELEEIIDREKKKELTVFPIFYNVEPSDVRKQIGTFALVEHEKQFKEKVETWKAALSHVANIAGYPVKDSPLSQAVKSIVGLISRKLSGEFSEAIDGYVGIESPILELASYLAFGFKDEVRFIGIWAMGGMGKTTLAKVAYKMFSKEFEDSCFVDNVRETFEKDELSLQKNFLSQIFNDANLNIKNKCEGEHMIKNRLRGKRILVVLDDVNDFDQLQMFAGKRDWFGRGSRIIITTRDKHLLETDLIYKIYEVEALKDDDARHLFCLKAFENELVPNEYLGLFRDFLNYVAGHPLALIVLGSFLSGRRVVEWENEFERLKKEPNRKVNQVLRISFDGLQESEKEIFLDIACFFNHEVKDHVVQILEILGRYPLIGLSVLVEKSLLKISENNELWMHDLLRDMGRDIVRQENRGNPGERSRLWLYKDIDLVLKDNKGSEKVQAMDIRGAEACWRGFTFSLWNPNPFSKMSNLKYLRVRNVFPKHVPENFPNSLRYLEWSGYLGKSLQCFQPYELVQLHLQHSKIEFLWEGLKIFENLKSINMDGSSDLISSPNFNGVQNLEELVLARCSNLRELHPSIGELKKLKLLDLEGCRELTNLPDKFEVESLVTLNLTHCLKVEKIPGSICSLTSLTNLYFSGCSKFDKLPEDLGNIVSLKELDLSGTAIKELPSSIKFLIGLTSLHLRDCKKFDKLPKDLGNIISLGMLDLSGTAITELPSSIEFLIGLGSLYLDGCPKFVKLPENLGNLEHLSRLCLEGTAIEVLPSSVERLAALNYLKLKDCKDLVCLPSTICNLTRVEYLDLIGCSKIANLPEDLGNMESLKFLFLGETAIKELPSSTIDLKNVLRVSFKGCQLLSSSLTSIPRTAQIDLSDCNLSAIPSGIDRYFSASPRGLYHETRAELYLRGNDFVSLPESISQFSRPTLLYLDGCKRLQSLPNIPADVEFICVDNCTSLERLPELPDFCLRRYGYTVQCFNCFKLAENIQNFSNMFQGHAQNCYIIPGREIPNWFEEVNICDTFVAPRWYSNMRPVLIKKVKLQVPLVGDNPRGIVLCVLFLPTVHQHRYPVDRFIDVAGCLMSYSTYGRGDQIWFKFMSKDLGELTSCYNLSEYGNVELHHLLLRKIHFYLPETTDRSIDKNGFHQVDLEIETHGLELEKIGFRVV